MTPPNTTSALERWRAAMASGEPGRIASVGRTLAEQSARVDTRFDFTIYDKFWRPMGVLNKWVMNASGTDPRNNVPTCQIELKGDHPFVDELMNCSNTMVGLTVETAGLRMPFYVKTHRYRFKDGELTSVIECNGIWDILNYLVIWPTWWLPIQTQPFSHAVYIWALCTVLENMVAECAMRIQTGLWEFVNQAGSLNPDIRAWFGTILQALERDGLSLQTLTRMLKTPIYVKRTNPFLDTSPLVARTVRMETVAAVVQDLTRAYGVETRMDLWLPGDPQPDPWANLDQPTYVFSTYDRSQVEGPTKTVLDSVLRTVVDLGGSLLGDVLKPIIREAPDMAGQFEGLGVDYVPPWAVVVMPEKGEDAAILECEIADHTPEGWQHIIGGRSPKWLNDLINATTAWLIDSLMIVIGFTGIPSDLLAGFLNNAFLAFQMVEHYDRRASVGPYHPGIERFHATASAPYNIETPFAFINALWDSRGYTSATVRLNATGPKAQYALGRDIFKGGLMSVVYRGRQKMLTDYIENVMWRITPDTRELVVQVGDGKRDEPPLAKHQRFITSVFEAINVLTLAPQNG